MEAKGNHFMSKMRRTTHIIRATQCYPNTLHTVLFVLASCASLWVHSTLRNPEGIPMVYLTYLTHTSVAHANKPRTPKFQKETTLFSCLKNFEILSNTPRNRRLLLAADRLLALEQQHRESQQDVCFLSLICHDFHQIRSK